MSTNTTVVEVVKFVASGLDEITARTKVYAQQVDEATARNKALMGVMNDPRYQQHAARVTQLNRQYDQMSAKLRNATRAADLQSGAFARNAQVMARLNKEAEHLGKQEQLQTLIAQHGRWGGTLRANAESLGTLKSAAMTGYGITTGLAMGLVRSGLAGTVQGYQLEMAWTRMGRQAAAIAVPAIEKIAAVVGRVAGWFERLSGRQQDFILGLGLVVVAAGPAIAALRALMAVGGAALTVGRAAMAAAGLGGAAAAGGAGAAAAGAGAAAAGGGAGAAAAGAGGAAAAKFGLKAAGKLALRATGVGAIAVGAIEGAGGIGRGYDTARASGDSMVAAGLKGVANGLANVVSLGFWDPLGGEEKDEKKDRRDVTLMQTSLMDAGGAFQMVQEEVLKTTAARAEEAAAATAGDVKWIRELLEKYTGSLPPPPAE